VRKQLKLDMCFERPKKRLLVRKDHEAQEIAKTFYREIGAHKRGR
jgi:hypothetical protein